MFRPNANFWCHTDEHRDFSSSSLEDNNGHAEAVIGAILTKMNTHKYCIVMLKWFNKPNEVHDFQHIITKYLKYLNTLNNVHAVNMSIAGNASFDAEKQGLEKLADKGIKLVIAAGNNGINLDNYCSIFPACYKVTPYVIGSSHPGIGNFGQIVSYKRYPFYKGQTGTSMSAGYFTGEISQ